MLFDAPVTVKTNHNGKMIFTPNAIRIWQTANLTMSIFTVGLCVGVYGGTLLDLAEVYETHVDSVVYILSSRSAGSIAGCLIAGSVFRRCNIQLVVLTNAFVGGLCLAIVPICSSVLICHIICFCLGFTIGFLEVGCNVWLITIWKDRAAAILQFYHFMFGVGAMLAPFGAEPFLGRRHELSSRHLAENAESATVDSVFNYTVRSLDFQLDSTDLKDFISDSRIYIPFALFGALYATAGILMFMSYLVDSSDIRQNEETTSSYRKVSAQVELIIIIGMCIYVMLGVANEQNYASMISVYVIRSLGFSKSSGAFLVSVFWGAFTLSRIVATGMSIKMDPMTMFYSSHVLVMLATIALTMFPRTEWVIWSMSALYAFGLSPFFGNVCAWALQYLFLNHSYMAAITIFVCIGAMMPPIIIGPFIEKYPIALMYSNIALSSLMTATAIGFIVLGQYIGKPMNTMSESHKKYDLVGSINTDT
ncbi:sodium-dependent glucose transporter 1A-like [Tropilaelaps mercedesae]|uniref:Major facilitator superfamily domain-containing protein 4A n=1 Tax=Tropilaelaps mercedesae TaxID=418985 RepID=A0A1V9X1D8_9ACAR|nr:sodium-dependent glucose transporter 1A-like [Tropilaelaps mercedesae]